MPFTDKWHQREEARVEAGARYYRESRQARAQAYRDIAQGLSMPIPVKGDITQRTNYQGRSDRDHEAWRTRLAIEDIAEELQAIRYGF